MIPTIIATSLLLTVAAVPPAPLPLQTAPRPAIQLAQDDPYPVFYCDAGAISNFDCTDGYHNQDGW